MKITDVCKKENCDFYTDGECDREEGFQMCKDIDTVLKSIESPAVESTGEKTFGNRR